MKLFLSPFRCSLTLLMAAALVYAPFIRSAALATPLVISVAPSTNTVNVPRSTAVTAQFSEAMDPLTITGGIVLARQIIPQAGNIHLPGNQRNAALGLRRKVVPVAAGYDHTVALNADGTVTAWGDNFFGQLSAPAGLSEVIAVSAGGSHTAALKADGTLAMWGSNASGQTTVPSGFKDVVGVATGLAHTVAVTIDGTVTAWGDNSSGQSTVPGGLSGVVAVAAGSGQSAAVKSDGTVVTWGGYAWGYPNTPPAGLSEVVAITLGYGHLVALKADGTVVAWGSNNENQTALPAGLTGVVAVSAGFGHTLALKSDGTVVAWGANNNGQINVPPGLSGVVAIAAGAFHSIALKDDGTLVMWGYNANGQTVAPAGPTGAALPAGLTGAVALAAGEGHAIALKTDGTAIVWGDNSSGQRTAPAGLSGVVAVAAGGGPYYSGNGHSVALKSDGAIAAWGSAAHGQTTTPAGVTDAVAVAAGSAHTVALKANGTVVAWGDSAYGQATVPAGLTGVVAIAAGYNQSVAVKSDGTLITWGKYGWGTPNTPPAGLTGVVAVTAGYGHLVAVKADGTVVAWGSNNSGQLVLPVGLGGVTAVAAGFAHSVALKSDGTVVAWGYNGFGQTSVPSGLSGVVAVAAGEFSSFALRADGTVVAWGANSYGETIIPTHFPYEHRLEGTTVWNSATATATFRPSVLLPSGAVLNAAVSGAIKSATGTWLGADYAWNFTTASTFVITSSVAGSGDLVCTPAAPQSGDTVTCRATPVSGYQLTELTDNNVNVFGLVSGDVHIIPNVTDDHAVAATFAQIVYPLTVTISGGGSVTGTTSATPATLSFSGSGSSSSVTGGAVVTLFPNPMALSNSGMVFKGWTGACAGLGDTNNNNACTVTMDAATAVTATFVTSPKISITSPLPGATSSVAYTKTFTAIGGTAPYTWSLASGSVLPAGLALSATGILSGTSTVAGDFTFTIQVKDKNLAVGAATYTLTIAPLTMATPTLLTGTVGVSYSFTFTVTGGVKPYTWSITAGNLPPGIGLNTSTGALSGAPTSGGAYTFTVTAQDGQTPAATISKSVTLTIAVPTLSITTATLPAGTIGSAYPTTTLAGTGGVKPYTWSIRSGNLPPGIGIASSTGALSGTAVVKGSFTFTIQLDDALGTPVATRVFTIDITGPTLAITTATLSNGAVGTLYPATTLAATGGSKPYFWSIPVGKLPPGLSLSTGTGAISGTPTAGGTYPVSIKVEDYIGSMAVTKEYTIVITAPTPVITTTTLPSGTVGTMYLSTTLAATGGVKPYSWSIAAGKLPPGLSYVSTTGVISGTPTISGVYPVTFQLTDLNGVSSTKELNVSVTAATLAISTATLPAGSVGVTYTPTTLAATGGVKPYTWSISAGALPPGIGLNTATGAVSGKPTVTGTYSVTVKLTDTQTPPVSVTKNLTITIN